MKKVCVVITSLGKGGAERFSALLTQMLFNLGYEIHLVVTKNDVDYAYSGTLFNLEKDYGYNLSNYKKLKILRKYFIKHNFDVIIDNRTRPEFFKEYMIYNYIFKAKSIISIVHSYNIKRYVPSSIFLAKILYKKAKIVAVSKEIQKVLVNKYKIKDCEQIYNPASIVDIEKKSNEKVMLNDKFILFYGRIDEKVKNFNLLLEAYKKSILPSKGIKLYIIGAGPDVSFLMEKIKILKLEPFLKYLPFKENPFPYVKKSFFTVLTSRYEGFPMVLIESLSCGTPVVSVNCKSGPKEVLKNGYNGLLVENHNIVALANAFNKFIENDTIYKICKQNAKDSVKEFSIENISNQWADLLK